MEKTLKLKTFLLKILPGAAVIFALALISLSLPLTANAASAALGDESPEIYCTYFDADGNEVDGNTLDAGTYTVTFNLKGVSTIAMVQFTAYYDTDLLSVDRDTVVEISDTDSGFSSMGYHPTEETKGNIVFGYISTESNYTSVSSDGIALFSVDMTFAEGGDAEDVIIPSHNPNLTLLTVDFSDGYDDEYALEADEDEDYSDYSGTLYLMTCDISPELPSAGHSVSGTLVMATTSSGGTDGKAVYGTYTIDVYSDADRAELVDSFESAYADSTNSFELTGLASGTYYLTISGEYAITLENITLIVGDEDITDAQIAVAACDFDQDGSVSASDAQLLKAVVMYTRFDISDYCDLNMDGSVSAADAQIVTILASTGYKLPAVTIQ